MKTEATTTEEFLTMLESMPNEEVSENFYSLFCTALSIEVSEDGEQDEEDAA